MIHRLIRWLRSHYLWPGDGESPTTWNDPRMEERDE